MVVLNLGPTILPAPALVHTVWPRAKKSRPCSQEVAVSCLKTFRATILTGGEADQQEGNVLVPSSRTWMYGSEHLLAILDVNQDATNVDAGKIVLTDQSMSAITQIQALDVPDLPDGQRGSGKRKKRAGKGKLKGKLRSVASVRKSKKAVSTGTDGLPMPEEFRRSIPGRRVIRNTIMKAGEIESLRFSANPCFDKVTQKCLLKDRKDYDWKRFIEDVPFLFQSRFFQTRNAERFGRLVHQDISAIFKQLQGTKPDRKAYMTLIAECHDAKFGNGKLFSKLV